jgi:hypothetical protein
VIRATKEPWNRGADMQSLGQSGDRKPRHMGGAPQGRAVL